MFIPLGVGLVALAIWKTYHDSKPGRIGGSGLGVIWLPLGAWTFSVALLLMLGLAPQARRLTRQARLAVICVATVAFTAVGVLIDSHATAVVSLAVVLTGLFAIGAVFRYFTHYRPFVRIAVIFGTVIVIGWVNGRLHDKLHYPGLQEYYANTVGNLTSRPRPYPEPFAIMPPKEKSRQNTREAIKQALLRYTDVVPTPPAAVAANIRETKELEALFEKLAIENNESPSDTKLRTVVFAGFQEGLRKLAQYDLAKDDLTKKWLLKSMDYFERISKRDPSTGADKNLHLIGTSLIDYLRRLEGRVARGINEPDFDKEVKDGPPTFDSIVSMLYQDADKQGYSTPDGKELSSVLHRAFVDTYIRRAEIALLGGRYTEATQNAVVAVGLDPTRVEAADLFGRASLKQPGGDSVWLQKSYEYVVEKNPRSAEARIYLAKYLATRGTEASYRSAVERYSQALALMRDDPFQQIALLESRAACYAALVDWPSLSASDREEFARQEQIDRERIVRIRTAEAEDHLRMDPAQPDGLPAGSELVGDRDALAAWLTTNTRSGSGVHSKPMLIVVATSGGGITAAYWTARCLEKFQSECPAFRDRLRLVTGASGGMLGAGVFVARLSELPEAGVRPASKTSTDVAQDSLTPVVRQMFFRDLPSVVSWNRVGYDRGRALDDAWGTNTAGTTDMPFSKLAPLEKAGRLPSLIVSPMLIEDKKFLLITNLDLGGLDDNPEFFWHFPRSRDKFKLGTAIRMNAAFPYVTPGIDLPTDPPRRVVDAGYLDNYGVRLACAWIEAHRGWLWKHTGGVVLVQIRAYPIASEPQRSQGDRVWSGLEFLTTPVDGASSARFAAMKGSNDTRIARVDQWFNYNPADTRFVTLEFECKQEVPLGWYLTASDRIKLDVELESSDTVRDNAAHLYKLIGNK
jgi:tetratricopeptide (TPR) repeat protein